MNQVFEAPLFLVTSVSTEDPNISGNLDGFTPDPSVNPDDLI